MKTQRFKTVIQILIAVSFLFSVSCKNTDGFAPSLSVDSAYQLAYGNSASDRTALANRIAGNSPPQFAEVLSRWRRFSGTNYYPDVATIVPSPSYCYTSLDGAGSWAMGDNGGSPVNPNTASACNTPTMNSLSWIYLTGPDRLFNIQNTTYYNGFFTTLKFEDYIATATVSSTDTDDDAIGVTIAVYFNSATDQVHTLSAYRTQGGQQPNLGWGLLHKVNGAVSQIIQNKSIGGANRNSGGGGGTDTLGWNGRNSQIRIERTGNIIRAFCSSWTTGDTPLDIDPASEIMIDLADPVNGLTDFVGAQSFGYETISQARATFARLSFQTPQTVADPDYLFDLTNNLVYSKIVGALGYQLMSGTKALDMLGYPKVITNLETQREFSIISGSSFLEL